MSGVEIKPCCCEEKKHPCCVKYWKTEQCACCCEGADCNPIPIEGCDGLEPSPVCIQIPPIPNPVIAKWEFNDENVFPNNIPADIGDGNASLLGPLTATMDLDDPNIKYWRTKDYPSQSIDSGLGGVLFAASTELDENQQNFNISGVLFKFKIRVVPGSSAWYRVEYTINGGTSWTVAKPTTKIIADFSFLSYSWSQEIATAIDNPAVVDNPNFAVRVISVFSPVSFVEHATSTSFGANEAYESCLNVDGGLSYSYVSAAPWGFDDVELNFISIGSTVIPSCLNEDFVRSESGCFYTREECAQHFAELQPFDIEFFEDVDCNGDTIPENNPGLPGNFCVVPDKKKLCPQWRCGCCGPKVECCTVVDYDLPCPDEEIVCFPDDCCEPPVPKFCCCVIDDGLCDPSSPYPVRTCVMTFDDTCPDWPAPEGAFSFCDGPFDSCGPCEDTTCNIGILFECRSTCSGSCCIDDPPSWCSNFLCCSDDPDVYECSGLCGSSCCTLNCGCLGWPWGTDPCSSCPPLCPKVAVGLCREGPGCNGPMSSTAPDLSFNEKSIEKDLTKGVVLDRNQQVKLNTLFLFGYGENLL